MGLYERMMGLEEPKIAVHHFMSVLQEYMLGNMTGPQAVGALAGRNLDGSPRPLTAPEQAQALALRDRILLESAADGHLARRLKALELENVLILGASRSPPYDTVSAVTTRLGV